MLASIRPSKKVLAPALMVVVAAVLLVAMLNNPEVALWTDKANLVGDKSSPKAASLINVIVLAKSPC